jgi:hypothetical protein
MEKDVHGKSVYSVTVSISDNKQHITLASVILPKWWRFDLTNVFILVHVPIGFHGDNVTVQNC